MTNRENAANYLEQVLKLPCTHEQIIPTEYLDLNGHMNVMYYTHVGNMGLRKFMDNVGLAWDRIKSGERGTFALRQVLSYLNELREGERVALHTGLAGYDNKRLHFVHYIVSLDKNVIASVDERVAIYIDMSTRRTTNFEPDVLEKLAEAKAYFDSLGWHPELSGAIKLKNGGQGLGDGG